MGLLVASQQSESGSLNFHILVHLVSLRGLSSVAFNFLEQSPGPYIFKSSSSQTGPVGWNRHETIDACVRREPWKALTTKLPWMTPLKENAKELFN